MKRFRRNASLFRRMLRVLLPGSALPLVVFGYVAITSHFNSLTESHIRGTERVLSFMTAEFNDLMINIDTVMTKTSADPTLKGDNAFAIRESLNGWRAANGAIESIYLLDRENTMVVADPVDMSQIGKKYVRKWQKLTVNTDISSVTEAYGKREIPELETANINQSFKFVHLRSPVTDFQGEVKYYLIFRINLQNWFNRADEIIGKSDGVIAAVIPKDKKLTPIRIGRIQSSWWKKINKMRALRDVEGQQDLEGDDYYCSQMAIPSLDAKIVIAEPVANIFAAPRRVLWGSIGLILGLFCLLSGLIYLMVRSFVKPIIEVSNAAEQFANGEMNARVLVKNHDEVGLLAHSYNHMAENIKQSHFKTNALYQAIRELFNCDDLDAVFKKSVELSCTQAHGTVAWFVPLKPNRRQSSSKVLLGLNSWMWKDGRIHNIDIKAANGAWTEIPGDRVYVFRMRNRAEQLGVLKVAYRSHPPPMIASLLHSLLNVVETAIEKQELMRSTVLVSAELEIAETVQRNMLGDTPFHSKQADVTHHYRPASRLGGDWFYLIEDIKRESLWVIMGDVTGHGLPQGLVTTAVKGALDVVELLVSKEDQMIQGPGDVLTLLDKVVARALGESQLAMTCVALKIDFRASSLSVCNAGHTFPIHIHNKDGLSWAKHLQKEQQPVLGMAKDVDFQYTDSRYDMQPGDLLVVYTDGLAEARNLDSKVFGRFLFRKLRQHQEFTSASELKREILQMFEYYTQGASIDDDVCFLIVQIKSMNILSNDKNAS